MQSIYPLTNGYSLLVFCLPISRRNSNLGRNVFFFLLSLTINVSIIKTTTAWDSSLPATVKLEKERKKARKLLGHGYLSLAGK